MNLTELSTVDVSERQRKDITPKELLELKRSILSKGLLHAPVLSKTPLGWKLLAGERRLRAIAELHLEGNAFSYDGKEVPNGKLPFVTIADLSPDELLEAELEENILRQPLSWMEEAEAKAKIHKARQLTNPKQTNADTAREISERTGTSFHTEREDVARSLLIDRFKDDVRVKAAKSASDAHRIILDKAETTFKAELARRSVISELPHRLYRGDCREVMKTFPAAMFDMIFSDPPYGIDADKMKKEAKHFYDDSADYALELNKFVLSEGFRITKTRAVVFLFCDIEHFVTLRNFAAQQAWSPWRTPLIWTKGDIGHAPWGRAGFVRTYETILFAVKGQRELYSPGGSDVIECKKVSRGTKVHAAEKPFDLLHHILSRACLQGDTILDPCCGSGSIFPVAQKLRLNAYGIELDETYHEQATIRLGELQNGSNPEDETAEEELEFDFLSNES